MGSTPAASICGEPLLLSWKKGLEGLGVKGLGLGFSVWGLGFNRKGNMGIMEKTWKVLYPIGLCSGNLRVYIGRTEEMGTSVIGYVPFGV